MSVELNKIRLTVTILTLKNCTFKKISMNHRGGEGTSYSDKLTTLAPSAQRRIWIAIIFIRANICRVSYLIQVFHRLSLKMYTKITLLK